MFDNLIFSGCSFTASSSNFSTNYIDNEAWPQYLAQKISPKVFNNLSIPGGGNKSIAYNLIYYLNSKNYLDLEKTFVGFNITGLDRIDTMCSVDHPNANPHFSWNKDFRFSWITEGSWTANIPPFFGSIEKNMGYSQTILDNCLTLSALISFLEFKKVNYKFMLLDDNVYHLGPNWWHQLLDNNSKLVKPDDLNMFEWGNANNSLRSDKFHPNNEANKYFAEVVYNSL